IDELLKSADPPLTVVTAEPWVLPLIDTTGWVTNDPPAREWIVSGWLARGTVCLLSGDPGVGKSLLGQQLATARWAGRPFLGLPSAAGP
ncbi:AAA family ATPase, partial [Acinetobacter baumannii]